jgi:hypothetical protein
MAGFVIAAEAGLLLVREAEAGVERHLTGKHPESIAIDPADPARMYVGTHGHGLWRSRDAGHSWEPTGRGVPHRWVTAVGVEGGTGGRVGAVYAGTEPSTISRSDDGGNTWVPLPGLVRLASADEWSFPPKPETHHVRWIETDPNLVGNLFVAIEAGALVRSFDRGGSWLDRVRGGPFDTHTAATIPGLDGRLSCAAGDGYFESDDGGATWRRPMKGLRHGYLVGVAVDPGEPETIVVSASSGPYRAYWPDDAEAYLYRKVGGDRFELLTDGLPDPKGTVASRLATHPSEPGAFYAVNNHGLFRSGDGGRRWDEVPVGWPERALSRGVAALALIP